MANGVEKAAGFQVMLARLVMLVVFRVVGISSNVREKLWRGPVRHCSSGQPRKEGGAGHRHLTRPASSMFYRTITLHGTDLRLKQASSRAHKHSKLDA